MTLLLNTEYDVKVCNDCGYQIRDPYFFDIWYLDYRTARKRKKRVQCSTCDAAWGHRKWLRERAENLRKLESVGPARCDCGRLLPDCEVATCHRPPPPPKKRTIVPKKERLNLQLNLWKGDGDSNG
jgi:hypothetical protein